MADVAVVCTFFLLLLFFLSSSFAAKEKKDIKKKIGKGNAKIGKNILDYNEVDMERLLDQWDENDDIDEEDKYDDNDPRKPAPKVAFDPSKIQGDAMSLLKMAKKGKTIMMFISIAGNPTRQQAEQISARWQGSLFNAQFQVDRYLVADDRALFLLKDGSTAWDVKDFLVQQPECKEVTFENQNFPGAAWASNPDVQQKSGTGKGENANLNTKQDGKSGKTKKTEL